MCTSTIPLFLATSWLVLASSTAHAQGTAAQNARFQALVNNGNQAANTKNYPAAITYFQEAARIFPTNSQAKLLLTQAMQAYRNAQTSYTTSMNSGKVALASKNFAAATTAFTAAGNAMPADKSAVTTAQHYLAGTTAIQTAFNNLSAGDYTDANQNYQTANRLIGSDQHAQTVLRQIQMALTESKNPGPYYNQNFSQGVAAMQRENFTQAANFFKTALGLPVTMAQQSTAQNYYNASVALQTAYSEMALATPNYVDAVTQYQTAVTSLGSAANAQAVLNRVKNAFNTGLNKEVNKGNQYLRNHDLDNAFNAAQSVTQLMTIVPNSAAGKAFLTKFQNEAQLTLPQALANGTINPATFSATGNDPTSVKISFQSAKLYTWYLQVPAGTVFAAANLGVNLQSQNMILTTNTQLQIKAGAPTQVVLTAASMTPANPTPGPGDTLVVKTASLPGPLQAVLKALATAQPGPRVSQFAVWIALNPSLMATDIAIGSAPPNAQEIATLRTIFTHAGVNPAGFPALQ